MPSVEERLRYWRDRTVEADKKIAEVEAALDFYARRETYIARTGMDSPISRDNFGDRARSYLGGRK